MSFSLLLPTQMDVTHCHFMAPIPDTHTFSSSPAPHKYTFLQHLQKYFSVQECHTDATTLSTDCDTCMQFYKWHQFISLQTLTPTRTFSSQEVLTAHFLWTTFKFKYNVLSSQFEYHSNPRILAVPSFFATRNFPLQKDLNYYWDFTKKENLSSE